MSSHYIDAVEEHDTHICCSCDEHLVPRNLTWSNHVTQTAEGRDTLNTTTSLFCADERAKQSLFM